MISALSPLDGRYSAKLTGLAAIFSEAGLVRSRIAVEVEWLIFLCNDLKLEGTFKIEEPELSALRKLYIEFKEEFAEEVKAIEKTTNHDVKAVEYFLRDALKVLKLSELIPFLHFAATSEDINNLAYAQMLKTAMQKEMLPALEKFLAELKEFSEKTKSLPMMARTHGQPASPTTVGKEFKNVGVRLWRQFEMLKAQTYMGKMNGATGNFNAHVVAYPEVNWMNASRSFVEKLGLTWQSCTTQIEPHDFIAELMDTLRRTHTILIDLSRDSWAYISLGYFKQKQVEGEVGSSTMPHKVNPIDFENAEGNFGLANALCSHFSEKLPISRWQRDLTDSTVLRNMGVAFGHSLLALQSLQKGLGKLQPNEDFILEDLENHPELLGEAVQTVMRRYGIADAYEQLKDLTRGERITLETLRAFIEKLEIPEDAKNRLLKLTPKTYIGLADKL